MDAPKEDRARRKVANLEIAGPDCGLMAVPVTVVMRRPGAPCADSPTLFDEIDLENAITLNLLEKQKMIGSLEWGYYVTKKAVTK